MDFSLHSLEDKSQCRASCSRLQTPPVLSAGWSTQGMHRKACSYDMKMLYITVFASRKKTCTGVRNLYSSSYVVSQGQQTLWEHKCPLEDALLEAILKHFWQVLPPELFPSPPPGSRLAPYTAVAGK